DATAGRVLKAGKYAAGSRLVRARWPEQHDERTGDECEIEVIQSGGASRKDLGDSVKANADDVSGIRQTLNAQRVRPRSSWRWTRNVKIRMGSVATTATAATCPHKVPCGVTSPGMPTVSGRPSKATRMKA